MMTASEQAAFTAFLFWIGQRVKVRHSGFASGFVIERRLFQDANGIGRDYLVRHGADSYEVYREFELEAIP